MNPYSTNFNSSTSNPASSASFNMNLAFGLVLVPVIQNSLIGKAAGFVMKAYTTMWDMIVNDHADEKQLQETATIGL